MSVINTLTALEPRWLVRRRRYCPHEKKEIVTVEIKLTEYHEFEEATRLIEGLAKFAKKKMATNGNHDKEK